MRPSRDEYLTVEDIPSEKLPNGMATIVRLKTNDGANVDHRRARIDEKGFLRTLDSRNAYFRRDWEVVG